MARENGVYLVGGFAEPAAAEGVRCFNTLALIGPGGEVIGSYRRTLPVHAPWTYRGGKYWDFDWVPRPRTLTWARAIENLAYTAVSSNVPARGDKGMAMVCSPEDIVLEEHGIGVHLAELDLDRVRYLREEQDRTVDGAPLWHTKPGVLRDWRRAALLRANPLQE